MQQQKIRKNKSINTSAVRFRATNFLQQRNYKLKYSKAAYINSHVQYCRNPSKRRKRWVGGGGGIICRLSVRLRAQMVNITNSKEKTGRKKEKKQKTTSFLHCIQRMELTSYWFKSLSGNSARKWLALTIHLVPT